MGKIQGLDDGPEQKAFRALCTVLRSDPALRAIPVKFRDWQDTEKDLVPVALAEMPCVILTPRVEAEGWWSEGEQRQGLVVEAHLFLAGTNMDDALNLYAALRRAIWPADDARRAIVDQVLGAVAAQRKIRPGALAPAAAKDDTRILAGTFEFLLLQLVNT